MSMQSNFEFTLKPTANKNYNFNNEFQLMKNKFNHCNKLQFNFKNRKIQNMNIEST